MTVVRPSEKLAMLEGALQELSGRFGLSMDGTVVREAIEQLGALQERCSYYEKDAAAAWDKCEQRRLEGERLRAIAARIQDARERDHWNDMDEAVDNLIESEAAT